jgi:hypothetical protein
MLARMLLLAGVAHAAAVGGSAAPQDPTRVEATLSAAAVRVGQTVTLEIRAEAPGGRPDAIDVPALPAGLEVVSTRDMTRLQFSLPGGRHHVTQRQIVLRALEPGTFRIPPAEVRFRNARYRTSPLTLVVRGDGAAASSGLRGAGDEIVLRAAARPDTVWVGEQLHFTVEALFSDDARFRLRRSPEYTAPNPPGFWTYELPTPSVPEVRYEAGRYYQVHGFRRAFFPMTAGSFVIEPATLAYELRGAVAAGTRRLATDSFPVVVRSLPGEGRPPDFAGAVGRFTISARLQPAAVPAGEATLLVVDVQGIGNVRALPAPVLPELPGLEIHPPTEEARLAEQDTLVQGAKRFSWVVIPRRGGVHELPAVSYAYFDPDAGAYRTVHSAPLRLEVAGTAGAEVWSSGREPLLADPAPARFAWVRSPGFVALQFLPLLLLAAGWVAGGWRAPERTARRDARRDRRRRLDALVAAHAAAHAPGDPGAAARALCGELEAILRGAAAAAAGEPALMTAEPAAVQAALRQAGAAAAAARLAALLRRLAAARYAPAPPSPEEQAALLREAAPALAAVERAGRRGRRARRRGAPAACVAALAAAALAASCGGAVAAAQLPADGPASAAFQEGVARFEGGDPAAARHAFLTHLAAHPGDAAGWYNLGNAYDAEGRRGEAIWAWARALRLAPRLEPAVHNLIRAGAAPELVAAVRPWTRLADEERLLAAALLWLAAGGFLAWVIFRRRAAGAPAAAPGPDAVPAPRGVGATRRGALLAAGALLLAAALAAAPLPQRVARPWVVLIEDASLRGLPDRRAEAVGRPGPGTALRVREAGASWVRVQGLDGVEGWLEARAVARP